MSSPCRTRQHDASAEGSPRRRRSCRFAVVAAPAHFPEVHEQAMRRLADEFGLMPREYPSTRHDSTPEERAADLNAAFGDDDRLWVNHAVPLCSHNVG